MNFASDIKSLFYGCLKHYFYDIHGNVKTLLQDNRKLYDTALAYSSAIVTQRFKRVDYDYDLISGKVNKVMYQQDSVDQFIHKYSYDADNRITKVETSNDNILWQTDAKYFYYAHGPLARVEYGNDKVQGMDYAYTLQGWIKGINSNTLYAERDMGRDADSTLMFNPNRVFAKDGFGYTLNYYKGDYKSIDYMRWNDITQRFEASTFGSDLMASTYDLYNGNIKAMVTTIIVPTVGVHDEVEFTPLPQGTAYKYDQLNRLTEMKAWQNCKDPINAWKSGDIYTGVYYNKFAYDANGNITYQLRNDESGTAINKLIYKRQKDASNDLMRNRLYHVRDSVSSGAFADDIDDQGYFSNHADSVNISNNYSYDAIGNLTKNSQKEIDTILYSVYGKVKEVIRSNGSTKKNLKFDYDANGNRTAKHIYDSYNNWEKSEYYVLDAQGNVMSIYENKVDTAMHYAQTEKHIFGSSRLGAEKTPLEMIGAVAIADGTPIEHALGNKHFDASNHLGNTLITFTDRKIPFDSDVDNITDEYWPDVIASNDYYPFGVKMKERSFSSENTRYQFNGKQFDEETETNDFGARMLDGDLGVWGACDSKSAKYPAQSPYDFCFNNPLIFIDPDGNVVKPAEGKATELWNTFKSNADKTQQAQIKLLEESDVTYTINYTYRPEDPGGQITWASTNNPNPKEQVIQIDIFAVQGQQEKAWAFNALGDEVMGAVQFDKGDLGFAVKADEKGNEYVIPTGYDWIDEVESKEAAIASAKSNKVEVVSSAKDYENKVKNGKMSAEKWIKNYKRKIGGEIVSYKKIFMALGGEGLKRELPGYITGEGKDVFSEKESGKIKGYIFRRKDSRDEDGKIKNKTIVSPSDEKK